MPLDQFLINTKGIRSTMFLMGEKCDLRIPLPNRIPLDKSLGRVTNLYFYFCRCFLSPERRGKLAGGGW